MLISSRPSIFAQARFAPACVTLEGQSWGTLKRLGGSRERESRLKHYAAKTRERREVPRRLTTPILIRLLDLLIACSLGDPCLFGWYFIFHKLKVNHFISFNKNRLGEMKTSSKSHPGYDKSSSAQVGCQAVSWHAVFPKSCLYSQKATLISSRCFSLLKLQTADEVFRSHCGPSFRHHKYPPSLSPLSQKKIVISKTSIISLFFSSLRLATFTYYSLVAKRQSADLFPTSSFEACFIVSSEAGSWCYVADAQSRRSSMSCWSYCRHFFF